MLGGHFRVSATTYVSHGRKSANLAQRVHRACEFNDNGYGTLSLLSAPAKSSGRGDLRFAPFKDSPPVVISTHPLDPAEPPMLPPQKPLSLPGQKQSSGNLVWINVFDSEGSAPLDSHPEEAEDSANESETDRRHPTSTVPLRDPQIPLNVTVWDYIQRYLINTETVPDENTRIMDLLRLPLLRGLHWNPAYEGGFLDRNERDILSLIIQVTGEEARKPCTGCVRGFGPYESCVVVSGSASAETRNQWQCANCLYVGNEGVTCSIKAWSLSLSRTKTATSVPHGVLGPPSHVGLGLGESRHGVDQRPKLDVPGGGRYPQRARAEEDRPTVPRRDHPARDGNLIANDEEPLETEQDPPRNTNRSVITPGHVIPEATLEMEEWEIAPGRVEDSHTGNTAVIAFSRTSLLSSQTVSIDGLKFRLQKLGAGTILRLSPEAQETRVYTIVTGKLHVKIGEEPEVVVGQLGMFIVKPGIAACILNRLYEEAALHVTVYQGR